MPTRKIGRASGSSSRVEHRTLTITTLGKFACRFGTREIRIASRKSCALLGYLAISRSEAETRERLVGLLWSESEEERARASLRQALHEIREAFNRAGFDGLRADKLSIAFDRTRIEVDLASVLQHAAERRPHPVLLAGRRQIETLLDTFETIDPAFRVWLLATRQSLHDRIAGLLAQALHLPEMDAGGKAEAAQALLNLDPTHEEACRFLIRARVAAGDIGSALRIYKTLWDLLDTEYDIEPSKETQELIAAVKMAQPSDTDARPVSAGNLVPAVGPQPIAIAPILLIPSGKTEPCPLTGTKLVVSIAQFDASGLKEGHRYLLHGFRRELIACLVRFREWFMRDGTGAAAPQPASGFIDEYILEGSAYQRGDAVRLILVLREAATNLYLWSERFQLSVANWFDTQQSVMRNLATALNVHLSAERMTSITRSPNINLKAYDLWLRGQTTILSFNPANWQRAIESFREVIAQAPGFAPAYSSLAQLHNARHIATPGVFRDRQRIEQALVYAHAAARLDPIDSRGHLCLGWSHAMAEQYDRAELHFDLAYELNDSDPWTLVSSAHGIAFCGLHERGRKRANQALDRVLTPSRSHWAFQAGIRFLVGDYEGCVEAAEMAEDVIPNIPGWKASALAHLGRYGEARTETLRFFEFIRDRWVGEEPASNETITRWFLHLFPIRRLDDWERLRDGLACAGAPVGRAAPHNR